MVHYRHTQVGRLILMIAAPVLILCAWLALQGSPASLVALIVALVVVSTFSTLTTEVSDEAVTVWFGPGLIRRRIAVSRIASASPVRNRWYYGWGIRLTPHGWLWNVSGLDAVELTFVHGGRFRIGSDEPEQLAKAIQRAAGRL